LYGEDLLVAPVTTLGATSRSVGLPAGKWEWGALEIYCRNVKDVTMNGAKLRAGSGYAYDAVAQKLTIQFHSAAKVEVQGATSVFVQ
jgi:hypothetical protein